MATKGDSPTVDEEYWSDSIWNHPEIAKYSNITQQNDHENEMEQFLTSNRIESLRETMQRHKITMDDINMWTADDAKEYCNENDFGVHIRTRFVRAIKHPHGKDINLIKMNHDMNKMKQELSEIKHILHEAFPSFSESKTSSDLSSSHNLIHAVHPVSSAVTHATKHSRVRHVNDTSSIIRKQSHITPNIRMPVYCPGSPSTSFFPDQYISKCTRLKMTWNRYTKNYELSLAPTSRNVSSFFERKYGSARWLEIIAPEYDIAFNLAQIHKPLMDMAENGVIWNTKRYKFFSSKDDVLYFFHETNDGKLHSVRRLCLGNMYSTKNIAKFANRISLGFSKTYPLNISINSSDIHIIPDIVSEGTTCCMTDGCGYIAVHLAKQIPYVAGGWMKNDANNKEYPLLIQCRIIYSDGLAKGVLIANPNIPDNEIHLRESMIKIRNGDGKQYNMEYAMMEINNTSTIGHNNSTLNRCFNVILSQLTGNGDESLFRKYIDGQLKSYFETIKEVIRNPRVAYYKLKYLLSHFDEFYADQQLTLEMILSGQNMNDEYLQSNLKRIAKKSYEKIMRKNHIPVEKSSYLMGVADPLGILEPNQVFIASNHHVHHACEVLISRNPCQHPGDLRRFTAVNCPALNDFIGYYNRQCSGGIFFSVKGNRAAADLLSNGDYDGDLFWVCWDQELTKIFTAKNHAAAPIDFADPLKWNETHNKDMDDDHKWDIIRRSPMEFQQEKAMNKVLMMHFMLANCNSMTMKRSSKIWLNCFELYGLFDSKTSLACQCYFVALDASKHGIRVHLPADIEHVAKYSFPYEKDFGKKAKAETETKSILMFIFKKVNQFKAEFEFPHRNNREISDVLDQDLLSMDMNSNHELVAKAAELDREMTIEYARLVKGSSNEYGYHDITTLLTRKYSNAFNEYCINNNVERRTFAKIMYEQSYRNVFRSNTRKSYWVPWRICGNVLNVIKAESQCTKSDNMNENVIVVSPKIFKSILLHKR